MQIRPADPRGTSTEFWCDRCGQGHCELLLMQPNGNETPPTNRICGGCIYRLIKIGDALSVLRTGGGSA